MQLSTDWPCLGIMTTCAIYYVNVKKQRSPDLLDGTTNIAKNKGKTYYKSFISSAYDSFVLSTMISWYSFRPVPAGMG